MYGRRRQVGLSKPQGSRYTSLHGEQIEANRSRAVIEEPADQTALQPRQSVKRHESEIDDASKSNEAIYGPPESSDDDSELSSLADDGLDTDGEGDFLTPTPKRQKTAKRASPQKSSAPITSSAPSQRNDSDDDKSPFGSSQPKRSAPRKYGLEARKHAEKLAAINARSRATLNEAAVEKAASNPFRKPPTFNPPKAEHANKFRAPKQAATDLQKAPQASKAHKLRLPPSRKSASSASAPSEDGAISKLVKATGLSEHEAFLNHRSLGHADTSIDLPSVASSPEKSTTGTPLSSLSLTAEDDDGLDAKLPASSASIPVTCPVCEEPLQSSVYEDFLDEIFPESAGLKQHGASRPRARLNIRQQTRFCRYHREQGARVLWRERNYPDIDWANLIHRLQLLQPETRRLVNAGAKGSTYLQRLQTPTDACDGRIDETASGRRKGSKGQRKHVTAELEGTFGTENVGYYGGRGARIIREWLVHTFATDFRQSKGPLNRAIADAGGVTALVERVLVPEVVVRLVRDDLGCDETEARKVMAESADLGKLLCEEENDEVFDDELGVDEMEDDADVGFDD